MYKIWWVALLTLMLVGCAPRRILEVSTPVASLPHERVFVATHRQPDQVDDLFGKRRPTVMNYGMVDVSIPPNHETGVVEWPRNVTNPKRHFATVNLEVFDHLKQFLNQLSDEPDGPHNVTNVFVHGYNTSLHEAVYRMAQIKFDFRDPSPSVVYAWPSADSPRAYLYDRDSVLFARDDLVDLLGDLTDATDRGIAIIAHSMGAQLTMEALRQIAISKDRRVLSRIAGVVLVSPDIDPDVFRKQAEAIGTLPDEFYILVARQDRALGLSAFLTGRDRVGTIQSTQDVKGLDVTVVDLSLLTDGRRFNHGTGLTSPAAIRVLNGMLEKSPSFQRSGLTEFLTLGSLGTPIQPQN